MSLQVAARQVEGYRINTPEYEGPLDLLLQLIERAELDITRLALAQVTDQYLAHLKAMQAGADGAAEADPAEVSGFLVIAARLVLIKSAALLPRPALNLEAEEEDPGEALARQLILYKRFKELARGLADREEHGLRTYLRLAPPPYKIEGRLDMSGITLEDLVKSAHRLLTGSPDLPALSRVVAAPRVTIREKIRSIVDALRTHGGARFSHLLRIRRDRLEIVVTFLAMLELIKRRVVDASQEELFGDIEITSTGEWNEEDSQLEFIE